MTTAERLDLLAAKYHPLARNLVLLPSVQLRTILTEKDPKR